MKSNGRFLPLSPAVYRPLDVLLAIFVGLLAAWVAQGNFLEVLAGARTLDTDYPNAAAAFEIFVRSGWHFPLGENPAFGGINIFFSDGAPWFALLAKLWFNLSGYFIPFDTLILLNFVLFAVMAHRLAAILVKNRAACWLITLLLVFNLIMPVRIVGAQHIALGGYWVVIWALCCVLTSGRQGRVLLLESIAVAVMAFLAHAYLGAMAVALLLIDALLQRQWLRALMVVILPLIVLYVFGVFDGSHSSVEGAKDYSLDLLAFAESLNWGLFPNLYPIRDPTQGDLILYLGSGVWVLALVVTLVALYWRFANVDNATTVTSLSRPLCLAMRRALAGALALLLFAMVFNIRIAGHLLLSIPTIEPFTTLYESFRVAGRFAAPMSYFLIILVALGWINMRARMSTALWWGVALVAVILQFGDLNRMAAKSQPESMLADVAEQRQRVQGLLEDSDWSGEVYKNVGYHELEQQRLIDRLVVEEGARYFSLVHGARLDPEDVKTRAGWVSRAEAGDLVIMTTEDLRTCSGRSTVIKNFRLCLVGGSG